MQKFHLPEQVPVVSNGEIEYFVGGQRLVDQSLAPKREPHQGNEHGRPVPTRYAMDEEARVAWREVTIYYYYYYYCCC